MFRIPFFQILKQHIHWIFVILVILLGLAFIQKVDQGVHVLLVLVPFIPDQGNQCRVQQFFCFDPEILGCLFPFSLGVGDDNRHQFQDILFGF